MTFFKIKFKNEISLGSEPLYGQQEKQPELKLKNIKFSVLSVTGLELAAVRDKLCISKSRTVVVAH